MTSRALAVILNAILWGSGYLYLKRGVNGIFAVIAHLILYYYTYVTGVSIVWLPILVLGSLYFAIDGYKLGVGSRPGPTGKARALDQGVCANCGRPMPDKAKFCPECGAARESA